MNIDIIVSIIASIGYLGFILFTRKSTTFENYSVADRKVGFFLLFASISANFIGPGFTLGLTQKGFSSGYFYLLIAGTYGFGKVVEGLFIAPKLRSKFPEALSIGDVVGGEKGHNSKMIKFIVGIISFGLLVGLSVVMSKAAGEVLNNFLGIPKVLGTLFITLLVTSYSVFGGLKSTMMTDALQFLVFLILLPILLVMVFIHNDFDFYQFGINATILTRNEFSGTSSISILSMMLTWGLGEMLMPFTVNSILAGKNNNIAKRALSYSGLLMLIWLFIMLTIGVAARTVMGNEVNSDQVLLNIGRTYFSLGMFGFFTVAIIGVIMSSQDALINCGSVVFVRDVTNVLSAKSRNNELFLSKIAGIAIGLLSILLATFVPSIIDGLLFFYGIWVPSVLVVTIFSIFLARPSSYSALGALLVGVLSSIIWDFVGFSDRIPKIVGSLTLSISVYYIIYIVIKKRKG